MARVIVLIIGYALLGYGTGWNLYIMGGVLLVTIGSTISNSSSSSLKEDLERKSMLHRNRTPDLPKK